MENSEDNFSPTTKATNPLIEQFVEELQSTGKSLNTVKSYRIDIVEFSKWFALRTASDFDPTVVDSQDILDYRQQMITKQH